MTNTSSIALAQGKSNEKGWAKAHEFLPKNEAEAKSRGVLRAVVSLLFEGKDGLSGKSLEEHGSLGDELLHDLNALYYSGLDSQLGAYAALKRAVDGVIEKRKHLSGAIELGALAILEGHIYVSSYNGAGLGLVRDGAFIKLFRGKTGEVASGSGKSNPRDLFLLGTHEFFVKIEETDVVDILNTEKGSAVGLQNLVAGFAKSERVAVLAGGVSSPSFEKVGYISRARLAAAPFLDRLISYMRARRKIMVGTEELDRARRRKKAWAPVVGAVLLFALGVSVFMGVRRRAELERKNAYSARVDEATHKLNEARSLAGLNQPRARELVLGARDIAHELEEQGLVEPEIIELSAAIEQGLGEVAGVYSVEPQVFLDLSLVRDGFEVQQIALSDGIVSVLDSTLSRLVSVEVSSKRTELLGGKDDLFGAFEVEAYDNRSFVLSKDGIREVGDEVELHIRAEDWDSESSLFGAFGGNIYVLNRASDNIFRYPAVRGGFGGAQSWLAPGIEPDLSGVIDWSIDGNVWILFDSGKLSVYSKGVPQRFVFVGVEFDQAANGLFTNDSSENIYLLDSLGRRIIVTNKSGEYVAEYNSDLFSRVKEIVVSEEDGQLLFGLGSNLYSLELLHLSE